MRCKMIWQELRADHKPGDLVCWTTIGGKSYRGTLEEIDNGTAIVLCDDGVKRAVRVDYD